MLEVKYLFSGVPLLFLVAFQDARHLLILVD